MPPRRIIIIIITIYNAHAHPAAVSSGKSAPCRREWFCIVYRKVQGVDVTGAGRQGVGGWGRGPRTRGQAPGARGQGPEWRQGQDQAPEPMRQGPGARRQGPGWPDEMNSFPCKNPLATW